jgi:outer membrane protein
MRTRIFGTLLILAISTTALFAQTTTLKIGYTDPEYILSLLPEYKQIESELRSYEKQLQNQLESKVREYRVKLKAYQEEGINLPDVVRQDKEKELISMETNIKEFEENAMNSMQRKQNQLLDPVVQKIQKAIDEVAEENGYTYIFSTSVGNNGAIILYARNKTDDISDLVLIKLGVTPPAKSETGSNNSTNTNAGTNTNTNTNTNKNTNTNTNTGTGTGTGTNTTAPLKKK